MIMPPYVGLTQVTSTCAYPMRGSFALLSFADVDDPDVTYVEFNGGARYVEQASQVAEYEHVFKILMERSVSIEEWA